MPISRKQTAFGPGVGGASDPRKPGVPAYYSHGSASITFSMASNGNDAAVKYAYRVATYNFDTSAYVFQGYMATADGSVVATKNWYTAAQWGNPTCIGLTDFVGYSFAAIAKNEVGVLSGYSASSAVMSTLPEIDYGVVSDNLAREVTGGNTIVDEDRGIAISGNEVPAAERSQTATTEYYGEVTATYYLKNNYAATSSVVVQYSEDYVSPGTPGTWAVATSGSATYGTTSLATSATGKQHVFVWDSYADSGTSELDTTVYLRIVPYDAAATGSGSAAASYTSAAIAINNRPGQISWENSDGYEFDKDTTPTFRAVIPYLRGGTRGFPECFIYESDGTTLEASYKAVVSVAGWEYETSTETWVNLTTAGIPDAVINGTNRMRFTPPVALAKNSYSIAGRMGEYRNRG